MRLHAAGPGRPRQPAQPGQSLVEFSVMLVFLVVLLMGVLDLGRAYFTYLALKDAAAEGAYFGSAFPYCVDGVGDEAPGGPHDPPGSMIAQAACTDTHNILYRTEFSAPTGGLVDWSEAAIQVALPPTVTAGAALTVTVQYQYQVITPFIGAIINGQFLTITAQSAATIIRVPDCRDAVDGCR